ncbi:AAA family ATPase [Rheinheimera gaetbuli]
MDTTELQTKLSQLTQLLPSQRECLDRLLFQLTFNQHKSIRIVGSTGSGKSVMALAIAELFSDRFNVAMLDSKTQDTDVSTPLMRQWFNRGAEPDMSLSAQLSSAVSVLPLLLIIDDADHLPPTVLQQLQELDCLMFCFASEEGEHDDITLLLNKVTTEDATQLLHTQKLNELEIAQRLAQADGNIHLLLRSAADSTVTPEATENVSAVQGYRSWIYTAAALLLLCLLWWFFSRPDSAGVEPRVATDIKVAQPNAVETKQLFTNMPSTVPDEVVTPTQSDAVLADAALQSQVSANDVSRNDTTVITDTAEAFEDASSATAAEADAVDVRDSAQRQRIAEPQMQYVYDEATLLAMDRQAYALQLAVLSSDAAYLRFKQAYPELPVLAYSRSWQGQKQLVLLLAAFSDKTTAKAQIAILPGAISATGPFIKSLQAVQNEIKVRQTDHSASQTE